ncbi:hypothetical protein J4G33_01120 [Actinotalea sp. BY-33]|uniref:DUF8129 domain-containing protein n=1 Tax=Actinotalea soli TaxID=2819234 RepID=A0A939RT40_9CELL|nr:hypothetical protein [Actinotalea soli]MBO1750399.1 hypothetical protein [Actinotalea soli]
MTDHGPTREELPFPDYDHLPITGLAHRIRSLDLAQLRVVIEYEEAHARRVPALQVLQTRASELEAGAEPSGGDPSALAPELSPAPSAGSSVSPATAPGPDIPPTESDEAKPPMRG